MRLLSWGAGRSGSCMLVTLRAPSHLNQMSKNHSMNESVLESGLRSEFGLPPGFLQNRDTSMLPCCIWKACECEWCRNPRTWVTEIPQGYVIGVSVMMLRSLIYASLPVGVTVTDTFSHYSLWYGATKVGRGTSDPTVLPQVYRGLLIKLKVNK